MPKGTGTNATMRVGHCMEMSRPMSIAHGTIQYFKDYKPMVLPQGIRAKGTIVKTTVNGSYQFQRDQEPIIPCGILV